MMRLSMLILLAAPLAAEPADPAPVGGIAGCTMAAANSGRPLPFGCANAINLMIMVDDPADLEHARPLPPAIGAPATRPVERHRAGTVPPLPDSGTTDTPGGA